MVITVLVSLKISPIPFADASSMDYLVMDGHFKVMDSNKGQNSIINDSFKPNEVRELEVPISCKVNAIHKILVPTQISVKRYVLSRLLNLVIEGGLTISKIDCLIIVVLH